MSRIWKPLLGTGMALILVACASDKDNQVPTSAAENQEIVSENSGSNMMGGCPMEMMKDITMTPTDTPNGIHVDFVTTHAEKVDMLRMAVKHMAEMHAPGDQGDDNGGGHEGHHGSGSVSSKDMGSGCGGMKGGDHSGMMGGDRSGTMCGDHPGMMNERACNRMGSILQGAAIEAQDIEDGARLIFVALDTQKIEDLRSEVRSHFEGMRNGKCPMMK